MWTYNNLWVGQFLVVTALRSAATDKTKRLIFFGNSFPSGRSVLFHSNSYRLPFVSGDKVMAADFQSDCRGIELETTVHAVCENGPQGVRAVRWCTQTDFLIAEQEVRSQAVELIRRLAEAERANTENPSTIAIAITHGWKIVSGGNGRQRILERSFPGRTQPVRITRHLPSSKSPVSQFAHLMPI